MRKDVKVAFLEDAGALVGFFPFQMPPAPLPLPMAPTITLNALAGPTT